MAPTRRTNQDNSRASWRWCAYFGTRWCSFHRTQSYYHVLEELARIVSEAVQKDMALKDPSHHVTTPVREQDQGRREEEVVRKKDGESSAGSKFPTVAEELLELRQKMKVLEWQLESWGTSRAVAKGFPFAEIIVRESLPGNFKSAKVKDYDDNADPEEHLARFENMAMLQCYTDRIKCKVFLTTLLDSAQRWFEGLAPQSIHSFKDFQKVFSHHFSSSKKYKKTAFSFFEVKKSLEESLRAYIRRFNRMALDVPTCATETNTIPFTQGLREGEFFRSLTKKVPGDFEDLLSRAEKFIMEETQKQKREAGRKERGYRVVKPEERGPRKSNQGHFSHHVPLKIIRDREIQECSKDLLPSQQLNRSEKNGLCTLHEVCYHNTGDGKTMKRDYVPPSIQRHNQCKRPRGPPWTFRQQGPCTRVDSRDVPRSDLGKRRDQETERKKSSPPAAGIIKIISGGSTNGDSNRARKSRSMRDCMEVEGVRRNEAVISFGPEDLKGVSLPRNDALIIQDRVANYDILRVFVDSGSYVNVIFKDAFMQMDLQGFQLETVETALIGFH